MKYLWAYSIPLTGVLGIYFGGVWMYTALVFAFVFIPLFELLLPIDTRNYEKSEVEERSQNVFFDILLYLNVPIVFSIHLYSLHKLTSYSLTQSELIGMTLSVGIILGSNGINVAHELGHRTSFI